MLSGVMPTSVYGVSIVLVSGSVEFVSQVAGASHHSVLTSLAG